MDSFNRPSRSTGKIPRMIVARNSQVNRSLFNRSQSMSNSILATPLKSPNRFAECSSASSLMSSVRRRSRSASTDRNSFRDKVISKDSRPLNDRKFQFEAYQLIRDYFNEINLNMNSLPLSCKALHLHQYIEMMNYLLGHFFKKVSINKHNYITIIIELMKKLNYPGILNKSWLQTAYSTNSWPHVLGTLHWLIILVQTYKDKKDPLDFMFPVDDFDEENKMKESMKARKLFDYFLNSYVLWNEQDMDGCEKEKQDFANFLSQLISIPNLEKLESDFNKLKAESDEIDKCLDNEKTKNEKMNKELMENEKMIETLITEIDQLKTGYCDEKDIEQEILLWKNKLDEEKQLELKLIDEIQNQEVSERDYQNYLIEKNNIEQEIQSKQEINEKLQQTLNQVKENISQIKKNTHQTIQEHNLLIASNVEKNQWLSNLLILDYPKTEEEEKEHILFINQKIEELERKNNEMKTRIQTQRMNLDMEKEKKTYELEHLKIKKKQLENEKNELEKNLNKEIQNLEVDIKNAEKYNDNIAQQLLQKEKDLEKLDMEEHEWKVKFKDLEKQSKQMEEHANLRFSQLLDFRRMSNERYKKMFIKFKEAFGDKN